MHAHTVNTCTGSAANQGCPDADAKQARAIPPLHSSHDSCTPTCLLLRP
jgi:hypothetical protein